MRVIKQLLSFATVLWCVTCLVGLQGSYAYAETDAALENISAEEMIRHNHEMKIKEMYGNPDTAMLALRTDYLKEYVNSLYQEAVANETINNTTNRWNITLSNEEIDVLTRILYLEAGIESDYAQYAVLSVIFNRVLDSRFDNTLIGVLSAPGQFSTWSNRNNGLVREKELSNIAKVLNGEVSEYTDNMYYLFFSVGKGSDNAVKIDHQWFH